MWMVAGLGNPESKYDGTRHNIGFAVVDRLADRASAIIGDKKFKARVGRGRIAGEDVLFIQPQTYMNLSGESVGPALGFYKLKTRQLIVVHDELDKPFGRIELKDGGGHGGHNGLRSLKRHLPDDRFARIRVGIGRPPPEWDPADYVLSRFSNQEQTELPEVIDAAADAVEAIINDGMAKAIAAHKNKNATPRRSKTAG